MWTKAFWLATLERALKTFIQAVLASGITAAAASWATWQDALMTAGLAALFSVGTSILSSGVGSPGPSLGTEVAEPDTSTL